MGKILQRALLNSATFPIAFPQENRAARAVNVHNGRIISAPAPAV